MICFGSAVPKFWDGPNVKRVIEKESKDAFAARALDVGNKMADEATLVSLELR